MILSWIRWYSWHRSFKRENKTAVEMKKEFDSLCADFRTNPKVVQVVLEEIHVNKRRLLIKFRVQATLSIDDVEDGFKFFDRLFPKRPWLLWKDGTKELKKAG